MDSKKIAELLLILSQLSNDNLINVEERKSLKGFVLSKNEAILGSFISFQQTQDKADLAENLKIFLQIQSSPNITTPATNNVHVAFQPAAPAPAVVFSSLTENKNNNHDNNDNDIEPTSATAITNNDFRKESYAPYIYKVLKQVHPSVGISRNSMRIIDSMLKDVFERIAVEAGRLVRYNKKQTLTAREIQTGNNILFYLNLIF